MSERSPPESSESFFTFLPDGLASSSMPVSSRLSGSVSRSRPAPPGNSVSNSCAKFCDTSAKAAANTLTISPSTALMTLASSRRDCLHVLELALEELVALLERLVLLEGERVDRAHHPQLALELAHPGDRRGAARAARAPARPWRPRARSRGRGGAPRPRSRCAAWSRPRRARPAAGARAARSSACSARGPLLAQPVELRGDRAGGLGLAAAALAQVDDDRPRPRRAARRRARRGPRWPRPGARPRGGGPRRPPGRRRRGTAAPRPRRRRRSSERAALAEPAGGHLEVAPGVGGLDRTALELLAGLGPGPGPLGQRLLLGLEAGQHLLEVRRRRLRSRREPLVELGGVAGDRLDLGGQLAPARPRPGPARRGRRCSRAVARRGPRARVAASARRAASSAACAAVRSLGRPGRERGGLLGPALGLLEGGGGDHRRPATRPASRSDRSGRRRG